jgi:glycosyltransferase involved in cell wall biosynthesis
MTNICKKGGISSYNRDFLQALSVNKKVNDLIVLSRDESKSHSRYCYKFKYITSYSSKILYSLNALFKIIWHKPIELIFCGHISMLPLAVMLSKLCKAPIWLQIYGIEVWHKPNKFGCWLTKYVNLVTSISRYTRDRFIAQYNYDSHSIKVLPTTFDERFQPNTKSDLYLKKYGLENKKILLTVSRLFSSEKYKGHDKIIRILPILLQEFSNLCYVIAGEGEDKIRLAQIAKTHHVVNKVVFLSECTDDELPFIYQLADVYVMPSVGEGFGIVFLEAIRSGLPVIAGNKDGSIDALQEGRLGKLVDPDDEAMLISTIASALRGEWKCVAENAEVFNRENFNRHCSLILELFS